MMTDEMKAMIDLAHAQIDLAAAKRDRSVFVTMSAGNITVSVDPWPEEDDDG